jgi:hypothetical protein
LAAEAFTYIILFITICYHILHTIPLLVQLEFRNTDICLPLVSQVVAVPAADTVAALAVGTVAEPVADIGPEPAADTEVVPGNYSARHP